MKCQQVGCWLRKNAESIAGLNQLGFLWDSRSNALVNFATQASALDGLDAASKSPASRSCAIC
jgi:hypothetical protein